MIEEKAVISISKEEIQKIYKELSPANYVRHIQNLDTEYLWTYLSEYVRCLNNQIQEATSDISKLESSIHVVQKGFRYYSEKNNALRYFFYGYFSHQQDELLQKLYVVYNYDRIERILNKKHLREIIEYLYANEIVQQKELVTYLKVSKTNIDRKIKPLIECGLVEKIKAGAAFYKLTVTGYEYYRKKRSVPKKVYVAVQFEDKFSDDYEFNKMQNYSKEDTEMGSLTTNDRKEDCPKELKSSNAYWRTEYMDSEQYCFLTKKRFSRL